MSNIEENTPEQSWGDYQKLTQDIIMHENELESRDKNGKNEVSRILP